MIAIQVELVRKSHPDHATADRVALGLPSVKSSANDSAEITSDMRSCCATIAIVIESAGAA